MKQLYILILFALYSFTPTIVIGQVDDINKELKSSFENANAAKKNMAYALGLIKKWPEVSSKEMIDNYYNKVSKNIDHALEQIDNANYSSSAVQDKARKAKCQNVESKSSYIKMDLDNAKKHCDNSDTYFRKIKNPISRLDTQENFEKSIWHAEAGIKLLNNVLSDINYSIEELAKCK